MDVDQHVARRIRDLRAHSQWTLERLAELSGVSRSTISAIERAETSPTATVLHKLATAFGIPLAALFSEDAEDAEPSPLARFADQQTWTDPASGYVRRQVSPTGADPAIELAEVVFPAGKTVDFNSPSRRVVHHQLVWMLEGEMEVTVGDEAWRLKPGDCLAVVLDRRIAFRNPTRKAARYAVALTQRTPRTS
ncbi:helix-turn-helix domain-containing protein [Roseateles chitosanitabidus]|uniref:helix-turn-helix domain-containing protein n=1 Tax=Roseateles chitosanitabidus TaxID=65048 RepID=UPI000833E52B|nr:XRE family transcriptional regulator [Roseateles chitosanitabidus]MBO9685346.1 helix-turn-helix transcriptional regulator [Roseateles chitosanitabidus]